ncbi:MAG: hypothetical protein J6Z79_00580 [Clostridia bacterium]|nr:hypothetical protein [Clostridia bacterium]
MSVKDTASAILKRLEEGTQAIYDQYREKAKGADASYQQKLSDLDLDYREAARALDGTARVNLQDRLTGLSDLGLASSGAAQQARISARTALLGALGKLTARLTRDRAAARGSYEAEKAALAAEEAEKTEKYRDTMTKLLMDQQNKDREFEAKEQREQQKIALQQQKLTLQQQTAAARSSGSGSGKTTASKSSASAAKEAGLTPDQKPAKMMSTIIQANRKLNKTERTSYVDRARVQQAVMQILNDTRITKTYRYQLYTQARAMGYIA